MRAHSPSDVAGADQLTINFAGIWQLLASQRFPGAIFVFPREQSANVFLLYFFLLYNCLWSQRQANFS